MRVLYLTYDGLTDPIGQSQVLPYLLGCARAGHSITVISFEKANRHRERGAAVKDLCAAVGLEWRPQRFRSSPPLIAKVVDQLVMTRAASSAAKSGFDFVHARSYVAGLVGLSLKRRYGIDFLFDMRGFWPDQRREGGRWRDKTLVGGQLFRRWKAHENAMVAAADHIIALTWAAKSEIESWACHKGAAVSVIPCCADFELFRPNLREKQVARERLGLPVDAPVLGYLGSIGTVYLLAEHLRLFDAIRRIDPRTRLLFVGQADLAPIHAEASRQGVALAPDEAFGVRCERAEVPFWLGAADVGTCLITPTYSSLGVSPTKLAEYLACGVPVIGNSGVGDVEATLAATGGGHTMTDFSRESIEEAAEAFFRLQRIDTTRMREEARSRLDISAAVAAYLDVYADLGRPVAMSLQ